jgi:hypothetical protein
MRRGAPAAVGVETALIAFSPPGKTRWLKHSGPPMPEDVIVGRRPVDRSGFG